MNTLYDLCGTQIDILKIKDFRIVQREYIYRPMYKEADKTVKNMLSGKKYVFFSMQPFAAIYDEHSRKTAISDYKAKTFKESIGKDVLEGVVTTIGDKLNIKSLKYVKYQCINLAGRKFSTYLNDIPAMLIRSDGKASDVHKEDELFQLLGEQIAPVIEFVPALEIKADENFLFYGNGIQIDDIESEYNKLKMAVAYVKEQQNQLKLIKKSKPSLPQLHLPLKQTIKKLNDVRNEEIGETEKQTITD